MALVDVLLSSLATNVYSVLRSYCHDAPPSKDFGSFRRGDIRHRFVAAAILTFLIVVVDNFFVFPTAWALKPEEGAPRKPVSISDLNNRQ